MTAAEALKHKWIQTQVVGADAIERRIAVARGSDRHQTFRKYLAMKKLKKAALSEIATHLTQAEVGSLGEIFHSIDRNNDGLMTLSELDNALAHGQFVNGECYHRSHLLLSHFNFPCSV
jgi:calcium-dependent protein kinase